jgi:NAD(P)H-hydrate epimerase
MKLVTAEQMRELDRRTIEEFGTDGQVLMERAGQGVVDVVRRMMDYTGFVQPFVHVLAGRGNNGGDGFVVARILKEAGLVVEVWLCAAANELTGDAAKQFSRMVAVEVPYRELQTMDDWDIAIDQPIGGEILIDALLGIGVKGPARGPVAGGIHYINARSPEALVIAVDTPSGLDADSGEAPADCVRADITVTMGLPKRGLITRGGSAYVGSLDVVDIGIPENFVEEMEIDPSIEVIVGADVRNLLPRRAFDAHKGKFGHVLIIAGSRGMSGAATLAARAAVRSGSGLVTVLVPYSIAPVVAGTVVEAMVHGGEETSEGSLSIDSWVTWRRHLQAFDAVLIGPGMGRNRDTMALARELIRESHIPLVIDADAISVLENQADWILKAAVPVVLTPHPGEFADLFGQESAEVQKHRNGMANAAAKYTGAIMVLKGAGTVVTERDKPIAVNLTGNPGMATGGTGDVLAGMVVSLLGQQLAAYDAARAAAFLHGRAGDLVAWRKSQAGLCAGDLIEELPYVFREISLR